MNAHICKELTDGCYRCELNRDEIEANLAEDRADAQEAWETYKADYASEHQYADARRRGRQMRRREFIAGFMAGRQG